jgi:hypothetical protein
MIQIVMLFCLVNSPQSCQEQRPSLDMPISLMECTMHGQEIAQGWLADHPKWTLSKWRCEANHPPERDL